MALSAAVDQDVQAVSAQLGLDANISRAIVLQESGGDPNAVGDQGCSFGLMQLNACAGEGVGYSQQQLLDPVTNLQIGLGTLASTPYPGDPGAWAAAAQRPANPSGYAASVDALFAQLSSGGDATAAQPQTQQSGQDYANFAAQFIGSQDWGTGQSTLCEAFVEYCLTGGSGLYPSAIDAANLMASQGYLLQDTQNAGPGDILYFSPPPTAGHTGVNMGDGTFVSVTSNGVQQYNVSDWLGWTGQQLLGYVPWQWFQNAAGSWGNPYISSPVAGVDPAPTGFGSGLINADTPFLGGLTQGSSLVGQAAGQTAGNLVGGAIGGALEGITSGIAQGLGLPNLPHWAIIGGVIFLGYKVVTEVL